MANTYIFIDIKSTLNQYFCAPRASAEKIENKCFLKFKLFWCKKYLFLKIGTAFVD